MARPWKNIKAQQKSAQRLADKYQAREKKEYAEKKARAELPALEEEFKDAYETYAEGYRQAGLLLQEIKKIKPWKLLPEFANFGDYCQHRFGFDMRQANHIIQAATRATKLGPNYPPSEAATRLFGKLIDADANLAKAAHDKLYAKNPNYSVPEGLDFLRDHLNGLDAAKLLPAATEPTTVVNCQRRMEKHIAKMLSELPSNDRLIFIHSLHSHVQKAWEVFWGLEADELENDPDYQEESASMKMCSDDPVLIEEGRQWFKKHKPPAAEPGATALCSMRPLAQPRPPSN